MLKLFLPYYHTVTDISTSEKCLMHVCVFVVDYMLVDFQKELIMSWKICFFQQNYVLHVTIQTAFEVFSLSLFLKWNFAPY